MSKYLNFGQTNYKQLIALRTRVILSILKMGISVLIFDLDQVWLEDPFNYINFSSTNVQALNDYYPHLDMPCGGFVYIPATGDNIKTWDKISYIQTTKLSNEQDLIKFFFGKNLVYFHHTLFPNGREWWNKNCSEVPVVVHANYVIGAQNKIARLQKCNLWLIQNNTENGSTKQSYECIEEIQLPTVNVDKEHHFQIWDARERKRRKWELERT
eukprot:CAMPEP_0174250954 /NCGR_PEP_ID=MMETSP0439-20130205/949_1 /TAXON_ID=0 /ORGANISM="Stereomyxa ramosa, Strain Chinc5" /LENGTH=212 /DNA_ID=CAMNT_0015331149 /DNA_START=423 /DNA_END=1061 /DNA_ORIENTATION=-